MTGRKSSILGFSFRGRARRLRGMSFVELMIAVAVFAVVGIMLALLLTAAAHVGQRSSLYMRSEMKARDVLDHLRMRLLVAQFMTISIQPPKTVGGMEVKQLDFSDPVSLAPKWLYNDPSTGLPVYMYAQGHFRLTRGKNASTGIYSGRLEYWADYPDDSTRRNGVSFEGLYDVNWQLTDRLGNPSSVGTILQFSVSCPANYLEIVGSAPTAEELARMQVLTLSDEVAVRNPTEISGS